MTKPLTPEEIARVTEAVRRMETSTSGEIFVVVARAAEVHGLVGPFWAAGVSLLIGVGLHVFTMLSPTLYVFLQALVFMVLAVVLSAENIRYRLVPPRIADLAVEAAARAQFLAHGIHLTEARTGVLIYTALAERRVEIVADDGINQCVEQAAWDEIAADVIGAAREGRLADGLVAAVEHCGAVLAEHFPPSSRNPNEIPDHVVIM